MPQYREYLVYICCQKQDSDSERGAMTEGGGGKGTAINRERRTGAQRDGAKNPERERLRDPEVGETETQREGNRDSERG